MKLLVVKKRYGRYVLSNALLIYLLQVYDGVDEIDLIGSFSGEDLPMDLISTGRYMFITFTSDNSGEETGFHAIVYKITS